MNSHVTQALIAVAEDLGNDLVPEERTVLSVAAGTLLSLDDEVIDLTLNRETMVWE